MKKMKKISLVVLAVALVIFGVAYVGTKADEVKASATLVMSEDKSYGTLTKAEALATINTTDSLTGNDIPNYEGYLFAGWFADENGVCSLDTAVSSKDDATHAKFVKEDTLSVKLQIVDAGKAQDATNGAIRFISSVDSLDYSQVGFKVDGKEYPVEDNVVYERIDSTMLDTDGKKIVYEYSPKIVGTKAEYFFTAKLAATDASTEYKVQAYWKTIDGTKVYSKERTVCVNDNASNIINMTLDGALVKGATHNNVAIVSKKNSDTDPAVDTTASVYVTNVGEGYSNVRITLPSTVKVSQFASATTITVGSASGIFRNHNTAYAGTDATIDTSWYDEYPSTETEFVISGSADLYGFSVISNNDTNGLSQKTFYLISDITVNDVDKVTWSTGVASTGYTPNPWEPISKSTPFAGTFDGQGHDIEGLYINTSTLANAGLFGKTSASSVICNFRLVKGYMNYSSPTSVCAYANLGFGSVAGIGGGTFKTIYSEVNMESTRQRVGGILGSVNLAGDNQIIDCWYAGNATANINQPEFGGFVGITTQNLSIKHCLMTGVLTTSSDSNVRTGGFLGVINNTSAVIAIEDCLNTKLTNCTATSYASNGGILGWARGVTKSLVTLNNVYALEGYSGIVGAGASNVTVPNGVLVANDELLGYTPWYENKKLDFQNYWCVIDGESPELKNLSQKEARVVLEGEGTSTTPWLVSTAEELKALSQIIKSNHDFEKKYIKLVNDITVIEGNTINDVKTNATENWNPIGISTKPFAGTFDGDGKSISGIYYSGNGTYIGLFGATDDTSNIKNLEIKTSYFETTNTGNTWVGSVAGVGYGTFEKIKSSATMVCNGAYNGGIVGSVWQWGSATFDDCWFAGSMDLNGTGTKSAGIIGGINMANLTDATTRVVTLTNCLNTGVITEGKAQVGGICGIILSTDTIVNFNNCLNAKRVDSAGAIGAIVADVYTANITVTMTDSFAVKELQEDGETYYSTTLYGAWRDKENSTIVDNGCKIVPIDDFETGDATKILEKLFVPDSENVIHWTTVSGSTPILSCFAN